MGGILSGGGHAFAASNKPDAAKAGENETRYTLDICGSPSKTGESSSPKLFRMLKTQYFEC